MRVARLGPGAAEANQLQHLVSQLHHFGLVHLVKLSFGRSRDFRHRIQWYGVEPVLHTEQQSLDDGESQWQAEPEGSPFSWTVDNFHGPLEALQYALHNVKTDPAAGDFGDLLGR